jgi:hypothetical protein
MNRSEFETKLNEVYSGAVKPLTNYVNEIAVLCLKCSDCGLVFFGKPSHLVGKDYQRHSCHKPYGNAYGERTSSVSSIRTTKKVKKKNKFDLDQLNKMVWEDYTYQQIASELKINPVIIKDYFEKEGLIE